MDLHLNPPFSPLVIGLLLAAAAAWSAAGLWRSRTLHGPRSRAVALALRLSALALLGVVLGNPSRSPSRKGAARSGTFPVLVDRSRSMSDGRAAFADQVVGGLMGSPALDGRLEFLRFGSQVSPLTASGGADEESRLGQAVLQTLAGQPAALVLVSDGRTSDPEKNGEMLRALVDSGVPVCSVPAEQDVLVAANMRVVSADHDQNLHPGEGFELRATVTTSDPGFRSGSAKVINDSGEEVARVPLAFSAGRAVARLKLTAPAFNSEWRLEVDPAPGETYLDDNRVAISLQPVRSAIRVLYMEGTTDHFTDSETGTYMPVRLFLPRIWQAAGIEVDTYGVTDQLAGRQNLFRLRDGRHGFCPGRDELQSYDVVISSDVSLANFSGEQLEWVRAWVSEKGGGFMMVGGVTSFADGGWQRTAWEKLIPFHMTADRARTAVFAGFNLRFDLRAERHSVLHISDDPGENRRILSAGVLMGGLNHVLGLKPGATALAWHSQIEGMPVLAVQSYGRGRTMGFTSDAAGGWGYPMMTTWGPGGSRPNEYYKRLWVNAVRWLAKNHLKDSAVPVELKASALNLDAGERARFTARLVDLPDAAVSRALLDLGSGRPVPMTRAGARLWWAESPLPATKSGPREVAAVFEDTRGREIARATTRVQVRAVSNELRDTRPDPALMTALAQASGGKLCRSAAEVRDCLRERLSSPVAPAETLPSVPRWDRAWLLALLLALLAAEWGWRKRRAS